MLAKRLAYSLILLLVSFGLFAQNTDQKDSLVRLLGCDEHQQVEEYGQSYRMALGHARFEHNSTLLICDTALWNVNQNVINAFGNVQIIQNNTVLSSESLDYLRQLNAMGSFVYVVCALVTLLMLTRAPASRGENAPDFDVTAMITYQPFRPCGERPRRRSAHPCPCTARACGSCGCSRRPRRPPAWRCR